MPRATRKKAPSPPPESEPEQMEVDVEEEEPEMEADAEGGAESGQPLQFNEPLTWRPGKQIPVKELLRRLKALSEELASMDQEEADRETLLPKAQELASPLLISHKDAGVKAYTLLCIVEMFRLLAPDAPYKGAQLKEIFLLFSSTVVPALANPSDPYNQQHNAILQSLTTVKSIVLLTDIPGSDNLILNLFTNCFDVMSGNAKARTGEKLPKNLEYHMTSMLCTLIDESAALPGGVIDIILAQFVLADPNSLYSTKKGAPQPVPEVFEAVAAYNMARSVCNTCHEKISRAIGQYFSAVLIDATETFSKRKDNKSRGKKRTFDESEDESDDGLMEAPGENELREIEKAHRLLRELWRSSPDVILNVVPQMEAEIEAENPQLRTWAVQTVGDMIAGIGSAGPPPPPVLDPAAYPSQSLQEIPAPHSKNALLVPNAPHAFSSVYPNAFQRFVDRFKDKAAPVRSAWVTEAGRILMTSGGGKGLDQDQEKTLLIHFADLLVDSDERVRLAAVQAIATFDFTSIVQKIGKSGSVSTPGSILCNLADRIKDPKPPVRNAAMELLGRIWGVAAGAIAEGSERVRDLLGAIPSKIFEAWYINKREINALIQRVLYESLLPVSYPPIKPKQPGVGDSQRVNDSQTGIQESLDPDYIRAERILVLERDLDARAKPVFFSLQSRQTGFAKYVEQYLATCEESNKDSQDDKSKETRQKLNKLIEYLIRIIDSIPDPAIGAEHLKKFAKHGDRRGYQLIRFCYSPESDYRKITKAMKELQKRMEEAPTGIPVILESLMPLVRSSSILVYNRSHVPAIVDISRTDEKGLSNAAHEVLKEISTKAPEIFQVHVHELCETLKKQVPSASDEPDPAIVDTLKACAGFARRFPEGMPKDRDFYKALVKYATHGMPPKAAKHAVTVIISSADKKEMYIKELQKACVKGFKYGEEGYLSKLATISQLRLLANSECEDQSDAIMEIAIQQVLSQVRTTADASDPDWKVQTDEDLEAKLLALRILVNHLRGFSSDLDPEEAAEAMKEVAAPIYRLLNTLIEKEGEICKTSSTPKYHGARLRLAAAVQLLKLSCNRKFDSLLTQHDFNRLSKIVQDETEEVRAGFAKALMKYLGSGALSNRFYPLILLYAFEPDKQTKDSATTWLRSRSAMSAKRQDTAMEAALPRYLAFLAHHPDFSDGVEDLEALEDVVEYIMFYLKTVTTETTLPMVYHLAQRLKTVEDGLNPEKSEILYLLSDIAQAVIRYYADLQGWSVQAISIKVGLPSGLFSKLPSHSKAQEIAEKVFMPDDFAENLEDMVKKSMRTKKRKAETSSTQAAKKARPSANGTASAKKPKAAKPAKTPKARRTDSIPSSERRKSARGAGSKNYAENDDSEDEEETEQWQDDEDVDEEANKENVGSSTPPTSDPTPAPPSAPASTRKAATPKSMKAVPAAAATKKLATTPEITQAPTTASTKKSSAASQKETKKLPTRGGRVTRGKKVKDIMDVPSDSE